MNQLNFFNTINLEGKALEVANKKAVSQEDRIIRIFKQSVYPDLTASEVHKLYQLMNGCDTPITSIRRAMTTLSKSGRLVKTSKARTGLYGKPNYTYKLNDLRNSNNTLRRAY